MITVKPKMKSVVDGFQYMIILLSVSCLMVIFISMTVNDKNSKYVKSHYDECKYHSVLDLYEEGSHICCDSKHHRSSWLCIASFDSVNKILSSHWAFLLPLLPYLTTISIQPNNSINVDIKRLFTYLAILLYRTVCDQKSVIPRYYRNITILLYCAGHSVHDPVLRRKLSAVILTLLL